MFRYAEHIQSVPRTVICDLQKHKTQQSGIYGYKISTFLPVISNLLI